ncbi:uncharacterized protein [Ptychodera flava]|uniref:uncharacterized protein n=1 Tax=Ptychodera flava TaxID=63121 RepID=UPI00396A23B9
MGNEDDKTPWEKTCAMILKEKVDSAMMQSIFEISSMDENYELMMSVIEMYEDGATKGQKLKGEELRNRPVPPYTKLRDFFSIKTEDQCLLLENVLDSTMTFADMCKEASILKKLDLVQRSFCQQTHCLDGGWEEAVERFPKEATRERLEEFTKLSFSRGIPDSFVNYCQRLLRLEKHEDGLKNAAAYSKNGTYAFSVPETISI